MVGYPNEQENVISTHIYQKSLFHNVRTRTALRLWINIQHLTLFSDLRNWNWSLREKHLHPLGATTFTIFFASAVSIPSVKKIFVQFNCFHEFIKCVSFYHVFVSCDYNTLKLQWKNDHIPHIRTFLRWLHNAFFCAPAYMKTTYQMKVHIRLWYWIGSHLECESTFTFFIAYFAREVNVIGVSF